MGATLREMASRCRENKLKYDVLTIGSGARLLLLERGGRIFGPFFGDDAGIFWTNEAWHDAGTFRALLKNKEWNVGGDRMWIAPEIQFHIQDRNDPAHSERIPRPMDPGSYRIHAGAKSGTMEQTIRLRAYNLAQGNIALQLRKDIVPAANPLRKLPGAAELLGDVRYCGYLQEVTLNIRRGAEICAEAWNITQVEPPGDIWIPVTSTAAYVDYYDPIDDDYLRRTQDWVRLKATGERKYKVGLNAAQVQGYVVYQSESDGAPYLYIKCFFSNPSAEYAEEPAALPGRNGNSVHVYNDDGKLGGFTELECNLQPVGGVFKRRASRDVVCNWFFFGEPEKLDTIVKALTGKSARDIG